MAYSKSNTTNISFTATSQSQVLSGKAKQVILSASAACYVSFDSTIVSSGNGFLLAANTPYTFDIIYPPQVSVIRSASDGTLSVMELGDAVVGFDITVTRNYTGDSNLKTSVADTFESDSSLKRVIPATFSGDANILVDDKANTYTGDAHFNTLHTATFTAGASLARVFTNDFAGDANLFELTHYDTFSGDSVLFGPV